MNLFSLIKEIFQPAADVVDSLHTSEEEKLAAKAAMLQTYASFLETGLEYEQERLRQKAKIVEAEAKSDNKLTSSWRPITMLTFLAMLVSKWTGFAPNLDPDVEALILQTIQLGLGGYVVGRSVEKVAPTVVKAFKQGEKT